MKIRWSITALSVPLFLVLSAEALPMQTSPAPDKAPGATVPQATLNEEDIDATREQLFRLLRMSPRLTMVVSRDPTLLADQEYVGRNNPELGKFLQAHPEIARNPEFYLFANLGTGRGSRESRLESTVWPEFNRGDFGRQQAQNSGPFVAFLVFLCILGSLLWLVRVLLENRRWSRVFHQQSEAHNKLLEKFGSSEEVLTYMRSDSGKHFFESAPVPAVAGSGLGWSNPLGRVLTPLQFGIVLTMVGFASFLLRTRADISEAPPLVLGAFALAVGLGLILCAGLSWAFARYLGLLPRAEARSASQMDANPGESR